MLPACLLSIFYTLYAVCSPLNPDFLILHAFRTDLPPAVFLRGEQEVSVTHVPRSASILLVLRKRRQQSV